MKKVWILPAIAVIAMAFQTVPGKRVPVKKRITETTTGIAASVARGKTVYLKHCLACHQVDGGGVPHLNPPLDGATGVINNDKARLIRIVVKGLDEKLELDGEYYSNNMASHADLSDQQIADVLTYIRNSWTNKAGAVTVAEVKAVRTKTK